MARPKLVRRVEKDRSQALRHAFQAAFLLLNIWIGIQFWMFVRYYESGGRTTFAERPAGVEGWLPIASLMNLRVWASSGRIPSLHPAGMFLLIAFVAMSWTFRKSFCSWLCPVGAVSEYLWRLGRGTFRRNWRLPRALDIALRGLKYLLMGLFLYAVASMSVAGIVAFLGSPYGIVDDIKMLNFFRYLGLAGGIVIAIFVIGSVFVQNLWCRYLCPYGALMGLISMASPVRIRRSPVSCIDCGKCATACPSSLPVDKLITIASAECTACLSCVAVCPAAGALELSGPARRRIPSWAVAAGIAAIFLGVTGWAQWHGYWRTDLPSAVYQELVPHASDFEHPR
ncbi:MAG TPA: 4Fe-4S binding protein [Candidatus Limnocylindrales bacterium]|nr:4Fe-4S binding protein [Candidatus Limnocylindrales bacterium]